MSEPRCRPDTHNTHTHPNPGDAGELAEDETRIYEPADWTPPDRAAEIRAAALAEGWRIAHDEACRQGPYCSAHQPIEARAGFDALAANPYRQDAP